MDLCQQEIGNIVTHLDYLEQQSEREESLLCDMNSAVRTEESTFSVEVSKLITDCDDIDHMS